MTRTLLLLLIGCAGRESYVPQPIGNGGPPDAGAADGGGDGELCSDPDASVPANLRVENAGMIPIRVLWSDRDCQEVEYRVLAGGEAYDQGTYVGHAWRARRLDDGELLDELMVSAPSETFRVQP